MISLFSFGIGLALLISGFTFYELANLITTPAEGAGGVLAAEMAKAIAQFTNIPDTVLPYTPYIGMAVMAVGVVWFWIVGPLIHLTRPKRD